jgi:hypothetical protein
MLRDGRLRLEPLRVLAALFAAEVMLDSGYNVVESSRLFFVRFYMNVIRVGWLPHEQELILKLSSNTSDYTSVS